MNAQYQPDAQMREKLRNFGCTTADFHPARENKPAGLEVVFLARKVPGFFKSERCERLVDALLNAAEEVHPEFETREVTVGDFVNDGEVVFFVDLS